MTPMNDDGFTGITDMLDPVADEAVMPIASLRIVRLIDTDGDEQIRIKYEGDEQLTSTLGLLEYAKQALLDVHRGGGG